MCYNIQWLSTDGLVAVGQRLIQRQKQPKTQIGKYMYFCFSVHVYESMWGINDKVETKTPTISDTFLMQTTDLNQQNTIASTKP